jgi:cbb3-type cytochrome oxidase maturation protein
VRILLVLIPVSLALLAIAVAFFAWAVRSGQFEDVDNAPLDMLDSNDKPRPPLNAD